MTRDPSWSKVDLTKKGYDMDANYIALADEFATESHKGQTRRGGSPYIEHPKRVAYNVSKYAEVDANFEVLVVAALLHDTVEDCGVTIAEINMLFGPKVALIVDWLTTDDVEKSKVGKKVYLAEKMKKMPTEALLVKLCDRLDNVSDLDTADNPKWVEKYKSETNYILDELETQRIADSRVQRLMIDIRRKVTG